MHHPDPHLAILSSRPPRREPALRAILLSERQRLVDVFHSSARHDCDVNVIQLLIAGVAIVLVIVIVLLAVIPSLLDYPRGRDKDESDRPAPTPLEPDDRHDDHSVDLAA